MLLKFRVANYRSIRDERELSFVASELNEGTAREAEVRPTGSVRVLPVIGLYGQNASGKSNVLGALAQLGRLATGVVRRDVDVEPGILGWDPFVLDPHAARQPTRLEAEFLVEGVRYGYGLALTDITVTAEWLHAYPQGRRQVWFERDPTSPDLFRFPDNHLGSTQAVLAELARPDRPFLSLGDKVRHPKLSPIARWFERISVPNRQGWARAGLGERLVPLLEGARGESVVDMLRRADHGIEGAEVVDVGPSERDVALGRTRARREVRLRHRGGGGALAFPMRSESAGTIAWLHTLRPLLQVLDHGGVLIVDELDASLHPELAAETIRMFYDRRLNRNGAQLLFSSHDVTMLSTSLGSPLLDRDQVWFTEKSEEGTTDLYPLAELKPRKGENIERGYLAGRYGAVPGLSPGELGRSLWPLDSGQEPE
jgi:energy-coupling factor transporter ATP-binding protein EcfA2